VQSDFVLWSTLPIHKPKFEDWKRSYHTQCGKRSPSCKPNGSKEKEDWRKATIKANPSCKPNGSKEKEDWRKATIKANPSCKPNGSKEKEDWRKKWLEGYQKKMTERMAVAAQQAEAMRTAPTKSVATVIEENKSAQADLKCKSCGESGYGSRRSLDCRNFVPKKQITCGKCGETGHRANYCRS